MGNLEGLPYQVVVHLCGANTKASGTNQSQLLTCFVGTIDTSRSLQSKGQNSSALAMDYMAWQLGLALLPAALASASFGFVLVRVRVLSSLTIVIGSA